MAYRKEWFNDDDFWMEYAPIIFDDKHWQEVPRVADGVTRLSRLDLYREGGEGPSGTTGAADKSGAAASPEAVPSASGAAGPRLLDLCCGMGRVSLELAGRGFAVTGVDITEAYLRAAEEDAAYAELDIRFIREDARSFRRPGFFDTAVNLYISFGYFEDPRDDLLMVRNVYESLKPGGAFIIETLGKEIAVRDFIEAEWFERAGFMVLTEYAPVDSWGGLRNRWILINGEKRIEKTFTQRLYAASELRWLLEEGGFSRVELYGDWDESPYDNRAAALIAVGRK
jgi:SAM-dependent methyltransferase